MSTFSLIDLQTRLGLPDAGQAMHDLVRELYPLCRSITGDGVRETLTIVGRDAAAGRPRGAHRHPGLRLDGPQGMEHPRRLHEERARRASHRFQAIEPARGGLQRAGSGAA